MNKKVIVYGSRKLGKMIYYDSLDNQEFQIACFAVDEEYLADDNSFLGLPQVSIKKVVELYPPDEYDMIALITEYENMHRRETMYWKAKDIGYTLRNYISPSCDIAPDVIMKDNNLIMGQTHIGVGGQMGFNNTIRQQVYLGHDFVIGNNNVVTAGCKIGGNSEFKNNCYIGLGATIINSLKIAEDTLVGAGSVVIRDTEPYSKNVGNPSRIIGYHKEDGIKMRF